jgi:uncharacterized membrane protein YdjX (TVP38/TMEM64 family)
MRQLFKTLPLMCIVLLVPVIPFLLFGGQFETWLQEFKKDPPSVFMTTGAIVGLLAGDIFLPVPSSMISTMAGWQLGMWQGTIASWIGMNLGAVIGFALARRWGKPVALWFSNEEDLERMQFVSERYGPFVIALTRAVPVFAEASVLIVGIHQLSWKRFLPSMIASNLGISLAYSVFGDYAKAYQWFPLALGVSITLPILLAFAAQRFLPKNAEVAGEDEASDEDGDEN